MRLPVMRAFNDIVETKGEAAVLQAVEVLEEAAQARGMKPEELDVIGELTSNLLGAIEVNRQVKNGTPVNDALNGFMQRVLGSIDK